MNYFKRRRLKKITKQLLNEAKHARYMREDLADPAAIQALLEDEENLRQAWQKRDEAGIDRASKSLLQRINNVYPPKSLPRLREYLEIAVVALSVAMAFRTFFVQPFKIPTGSMEPTLYGIKITPQYGKHAKDYFPLNVVNFLLFGDRYVEIRATRSGVVDQLLRTDEGIIYSRNGIVPPFSEAYMRHVEPGQYVNKGQVLASGRRRMGDHIFVNKVRYNFARPKRGDIFVFSTDGIDFPDVKEDSFYIKRLVGLPGEVVALNPPYLYINGKRILEPEVFERQAHASDKGYVGYAVPSPQLGKKNPVITQRNVGYRLDDHAYLPMGDNTLHSLDGRYFGGVDEANIVGPAFAIYWPISERWGWTK